MSVEGAGVGGNIGAGMVTVYQSLLSKDG